ncbi:hypothetical protein BY996DRAFT_4583869 [Phakopsora pachyrhizi]|uniref:Golgi apparatus membrane protein TVP23 n=1 Tax=Phakopsora pachyrhizi TaxID=170000 RepID=A0AAV0BTI5_PHAPC|nr:hypothetical protein BY996DRAFT_4584038 [Phakopsora pachyrhizi]KAI8452916.1 hypothetical protein BY996DRAFT_4583869 [Phakopsora pachyrhizi]CAH7689610.1 hypothetical protein PPACK8108_LOCUS24733 [Phakopsora pachyrhizi]
MSQHNNQLGSTPSSLNLLSSAQTNGLGTIAADSNELESGNQPSTKANHQSAHGNIQPENNTNINSSSNNSTSNQNQSIWQQSSHPIALFFLYLFRSLAIATYLLCGFFSDSYVFSTVIVVILLSADFWTVKNVSGRVLVGLRFWNQVDDVGASYWVFESRDPSQPANAVDSKMFWIAVYAFPLAWVFLLFIGILKFNLSFLPIVILALIFNFTNTIGFTYADRDAKKRWASGISSGATGLFNQFGGSMIGGLAKAGMGKFFG